MKRYLIAGVVLVGLLGVRSAWAESPAMATILGPIQDFRGTIEFPSPPPPENYTIIINTRFWKIRDRIIIETPKWPDLRMGGYAYVTSPTPDLSGDVTITTFYGKDVDPALNPMKLTGFTSEELNQGLVMENEQFFADNGLVYNGTPLGTIAISDLPTHFPGFDFSNFDGNPSSFVYAFSTPGVPGSQVPEPASAMAILGIGAIAAMRRRRA